MSNNNQQSLGDAIQAFLKRYKLEAGVNKADLIRSWETIMGTSISRHTQSIELKGKVLVIRLDSAVLRHELAFAKEKIAAKVNEYFDKDLVDEVLLS